MIAGNSWWADRLVYCCGISMAYLGSCHVITYSATRQINPMPSCNFDSSTIEVWEWISDSSQLYNGCNYISMLGLRWTMLVKGPQAQFLHNWPPVGLPVNEYPAIRPQVSVIPKYPRNPGGVCGVEAPMDLCSAQPLGCPFTVIKGLLLGTMWLDQCYTGGLLGLHM